MSGVRQRGPIAVAIAVATFVLVALAAAGDPVPLAVERPPERFVAPSPPDERSSAEADDGRAQSNDRTLGETGSALAQLATVAVLAALVVVLGRALARAVRSQERDPPWGTWDAPPEPTGLLSDAVEEGLSTLAAGPLDDAIVACWVKLEAAAAGAGVTRHPSETATELTVRLLLELDVPPRPVGQLLGLYRTARFSDHRLGEDDRESAVAALHEISASIGRVPS